MIVTEPFIYPKGGYYSKMKLSLGLGGKETLIWSEFYIDTYRDIC